MIRALSAILIGLSLMASVIGNAQAVQADMISFTCAELKSLLSAKDPKASVAGFTIVYWLAGFEASEEQGTVVDIEALDDPISKLMTHCDAEPKVSLMLAGDKAFGDQVALGPYAVALESVDCAYVTKYNVPEENAGPDMLVTWLAGHLSHQADVLTVDTDAILAAFDKVAASCKKNPKGNMFKLAEQYLKIE